MHITFKTDFFNTIELISSDMLSRKKLNVDDHIIGFKLIDF